jgi:2-polyprenyl-6-methoxyphenol hydroxylase-like FAD-dependent oxidoreductase
MTPFRGVGANTALQDAANLRRTLVAVDRGETELVPALSRYEHKMIDYGFRAVRASLQNMERFHAESGVTRALTKAMFRVVDRLPPLKPMFLGR